MRFTKFLISLAIICCCALHGIAQTVEYDTSVVEKIEAPVDEEVISEDTVDDEATDDYVTDTVLAGNNFSLSRDSILALKKTEKLGYSNYLDSMLQAEQRRYDKQDKETTPQSSGGTSWLELFFASGVTQMTFWILAGTFILLILYKLFFTQGFFQRRSARIKVKELSEEPEEELVAAGDYGTLIAQAVAGKQYRLATRYHFLQSLYQLSEAGHLQLTADKTNDAYLRELDGRPQQHTFGTLMRQYEYVWYGQFDISETIFLQLQDQFNAFKQLK